MRLFTTGLAIAGMVSLVGCGKEDWNSESPPEEVKGDVWRIPEANRLEGLPGSVYSSQRSSPIHWQPWTKETFELARDSRRLILAVVALPQQPDFAGVLGQLSRDASMVALINDTYVPVLVDGDAVREIAILTADLCAEIGSGLQLPLMIWMTPTGNPVVWIPLSSSNSSSAAELFAQSHAMIGRMWAEDASYVSANSAMDQGNRRERLTARIRNREISTDPATDSVRALRQLTSLYDRFSRTFDEAGGLFPCGALDLLSMGARMEGLPDEIREKSRLVLGYVLEDLVVSPMFDPLDGGVYNFRRGTSWKFPGFFRDCSAQARVVVSLMDAYEATGDKRALDRALGVLDFIETNYRTASGLFRLGSGESGETGERLWRHEEVKALLTDEEMAVWIPASGMKKIGNLPSEVDPLRKFFRENSISFAKSPEEVADSLGADAGKVEETLDRARRKLLSARDKSLRTELEPAGAHAVSTFRVVSAYASAYRITGDVSFRERAVETLAKAKLHFSAGPRLNLYEGKAPPSLVAGRAFLYGTAIQAALDVQAVTLDKSWLLWAGDLSSTAAEAFSAGNYLRECPASADLIGLPISDLAMLFDESSVGLLAMSESRLDSHGIPLVPSMEKQVIGLPMAALESPILHTDMIQAALMRGYGTTYVFGNQPSAEIREALARSPLKGVNRRQSGSVGGLEVSPAPSEVLRVAPGGKVSPVKSVGEIAVPSLP